MVLDRTYVYTEGDTISFHNDTINESYSYDYMGLTRYIDDKPTSSVVRTCKYLIMFGHMDKPDNGLTSSWTPSYGEAGTYFFVRDIVRMKIILQLL